LILQKIAELEAILFGYILPFYYAATGLWAVSNTATATMTGGRPSP
jgi:hypothetical protein